MDRSTSRSARALSGWYRTGARVLIHEVKLGVVVGIGYWRRRAASESGWRPRRRAAVAAPDVEVGSVLLLMRVRRAYLPLAARTVTAVARNRMRRREGWHEANSGGFRRRLVRRKVPTVSGAGSISPHRAWVRTGIRRSFGRRRWKPTVVRVLN